MRLRTYSTLFVIIFGLVSNFSLFGQDSTFRLTMSDGTRLFVRIAGKGNPCLFLHGGPGSTSHYFYAGKAAKLLESKLSMIYYDQRGSGLSDSATNKDYNIDRMVQDMEEIRIALHIKKWTVMGHSFAGIVMTKYAIRYPNALQYLLYINPTLDFSASLDSHRSNGLVLLQLPDTGYVNKKGIPILQRVIYVHNKLRAQGLYYKLMFRNAYEKQVSDSLSFLKEGQRFNFAQGVWNIKEYFADYTSLTVKINTPCLVIYGEEDYAAGPNHWKKFQFRKASYVKYFGGHMPFQEEPQWFFEKVMSFLHKAR